MKKTRSIISWALILCILLYAYYLRRNTFWFAHWSGDQEIYIALAMKLDKYGLDQYNLRGIDVLRHDIPVFDTGKELVIGEVVPAPKGERGYLLSIRDYMGLSHYDQPFYFMAPAFPYALMLSNRMFDPEHRYRGAAMNINRVVYHYKPIQYFKAQFYAAIIPLVFGLGLILVTFLLGKELFSEQVGLYAAFMLTVNPMNILSSQRIWTDDMAAFFISLTALFFALSFRNKGPKYAVLCGITAGLATLTRQTSMLILIAIVLYTVFINLKGLKSWRAVYTLLLNRTLWIIGGVFTAITAFWFIKVFTVYGNPFYIPDMHSAQSTDKTSWWEITRNRPHPVILFLVGLPYLSPLFIFALNALKDCAAQLRESFHKMEFRPMSFLVFWIAVYLGWAVLMNDYIKEYRYMIPVYPAVAIIASLGLVNLKTFIRSRLGQKQLLIPEIIIIAVLIACSIWSVPIGTYSAVINKSEIVEPF